MATAATITGVYAMTAPRKRKPDWRTYPRDEFAGQTFTTYLVCLYPRGYDYRPDEVPPEARRLHGRRAEPGSGKPQMLPAFLEWAMKEKGRPFDRARVQKAIAHVRARYPDEVAVLAYRQGYGPFCSLTPAQYCDQTSQPSQTMSDRFYRAIELVWVELSRVPE